MYSSKVTRLTAGSLTVPMPLPSSELNVDGTYGYSVGDKVLLVSNTMPMVCTREQITTLQPSAAKMQHNPGVPAPYDPTARAGARRSMSRTASPTASTTSRR